MPADPGICLREGPGPAALPASSPPPRPLPASHEPSTPAPSALRPALVSTMSTRRATSTPRRSVTFHESAQAPARNPPGPVPPQSAAYEASSSTRRGESGETGASPGHPSSRDLHDVPILDPTRLDDDSDPDMTEGDTSSPPRAPSLKPKRTRTRTGCLNCRRKKRKCDEQRPACGGCARRCEPCRWGVKVTFRDINAQSIRRDHPSMMRGSRRRPRRYEIMDVTDDVIRDYFLPPGCGLTDHERETEDDDESLDADFLSPPAPPPQPPAMPSSSSRHDGDAHAKSFLGTNQDHSPSSSSQVNENAVANLLYFSQGGSAEAPGAPSSHVQPVDTLPMDHMLHPAGPFNPFDFGDSLFTPDGSSLEDGIFLPGSAYHELHSTLRSHLIHEVRSNGPTRACTPADTADADDHDASVPASAPPLLCPSPRELSYDHEPPRLSGEDECALWKNWFEEISPWVDKFDNDRHFQHVLPGMARSHDHLRYSMLALSARQRELKSASRATDLSLSLYQEAIHLLLPRLSTRATPVIASCIVLCVLEMCSCSPKAWRRHLDGCASLMEAVGMTGFGGGLEQALFWCFARMDVCGGLISSVKTLIPTGHWASRVDMAADAALFRSAPSFAMWANYAVYLCAQVLDLLAPLARANPGGLFFEGPGPRHHDAGYRSGWLALWRLVDEWHALRPPEMCHVFALAAAVGGPDSECGNPFPAVIYSNSAAISGNQMYHTAALLMLQNKPASLRLGPRSRSALWHARQICAISMSNHHHGAWTNSIQPLWIAGRCMSHPAEHRAILDLYAKIERESGWSTKWRADDLQEFWGDLVEDEP